MSAGDNGADPFKPTPSKLHRILAKAHEDAKTGRAIANTAKGRRIKAKQAKDEEKGKK